MLIKGRRKVCKLTYKVCTDCDGWQFITNLHVEKVISKQHERTFERNKGYIGNVQRNNNSDIKQLGT